MAQKVLNEEQMREYVENEVRNALLSENIDEGMVLNLLKRLFGGKNGNGGNIDWASILEKLPGFSWETVIGAALGRIAIAPILTKLLVSLGIPADSKFAQFIINTAVTAGGAYLGDWVDKNHNLIGGSNGPKTNTSLGGGAGFLGGGEGGGSR